jgi:hypothetical protein
MSRDFDDIPDLEFDDEIPELEFDDDAPELSFEDSKSADKSFTQKAGDFIQSANATIQDIMPFTGVADKAAAAAYATVGEGVDLFRDKDKQRDWKDRYQEQVKLADQTRQDTKARSGAGEVAGTIAGIPLSMASGPAATGGTGPLAAMLARMGLGVGEAVIDQGTRNPNEAFDTERAEDAAIMTGAISGAAESLPIVGKGIRGLKKAIPGTSGAFDAVNEATAKLSSMIPWHQAKKGEIKELLDNPELRKQARQIDIGTETEKLTEMLPVAEQRLKGAVGDKFEDLERIGLDQVTPNDADAFIGAKDDLRKIYEKVQEYPDYFPQSVKDRLNRVFGVMEGDAPQYYDKSAGNVKERILDARRELDADLKHKEFSKLPAREQEVTGEARGVLQDYLHNKLSGSEQRREADQLYSQFRRSSDDVMGMLKGKSPSGEKEFTSQKVGEVLRSGTGKGTDFDRRLAKMQDWVKEAEPKIGQIPEVQEALGMLEDLRRTGDLARLIGAADRTGGPSSPAMRMALQGAAAGATGGLSLLLMPVTDPGGWTRFIDNIGAPVAEQISRAAQAIAKTDPAFVTRMYMLNRENEEPAK